VSLFVVISGVVLYYYKKNAKKGK